ncbi:MAG TPA: N,N-dimethylformamidase beta subunit family domain-containing protein [Solirubrobacteraceae bacterium]|nr:N,N-dimethylformamidase beta subunit family domain-containing protein [Solirubrobacteraceae bacterium]
MKRFPLYVFGGLVVATIAAFFITQHLKVSTPFVGGFPNPDPSAINPIDGRACLSSKGILLGHRSTAISFYLQNRSDDVNVYIVNADGDIIDQVASGVHMRGGKHPLRHKFFWNGHQSDGTFAPDGTYFFHVALIHQGRAINVGGPITVKTIPPHPVVTGVSPNLIPEGSTPVTIRFSGTERRQVTILIYRTDLGAAPRLVDSFATTRRHSVFWNGRIAGALAPAGTYLIGLRVTDLACNIGHFPVVLPPPPGSTPHAGLTVRYLAADPPATPTEAGVRATVFVDSRTRPYRWTLSAYRVRKPLATGSGSGPQLSVRMPRSGPGLYELYVRSGANRTAVPLVSNASSATHHARILVVLPSLTWEGQILGDEDGDGVPDTLDAGVPVGLHRVFANGLPAGLPAEEAFLAYLNKAHLSYDLTTDLGVIEGDGPALGGYKGVVFAGSERWVPASFVSALQTYMQHGGHVLSIGLDSFRRRIALGHSGPSITQALNPTPPANPDALGANIGSIVHTGLSILTISDGLGIFTTTSGVFQGFGSYQQITPTTKPLSGAGPSTASALAIAGYKLGGGTVVEVGLVGFASELARNVDAQEFINHLWSVLSR